MTASIPASTPAQAWALPGSDQPRRGHDPRQGFAAARAEQSGAAYRAARRHSRVVRFLRLAIPLGAALSFAGFIVLPFVNPFRYAGVTVGAIKMDGTRVTMENPRLAGHRKDNRPYEVTATSAVQDIRIPNIIELSEMKARLENADGGVMNLAARKAVFDSQKEQLQLTDDVRLRTQAGQEANLKSATVDFKAGTVRSTEPIAVRMPDMGLTADGLDVTDNGAVISFIGRVSALIDDKDSTRAGAAPARAAPAAPTPPAAVQPAPVPPAPVPPAAAPAASPAPAGARPASAPPVAAAPPAGTRPVTVIDPATGQPRPAPRAP